MDSIDTIARNLQPHYSHFDVANRLLFSGHSHQAWPDVALDGLRESFTTAASDVDTKWATAFEKTEKLRNYLRNFYDDPDGMYCCGQNTHQLLVAWLSSYNIHQKPKIITTDGEFHSMARQLHRLSEEGLKINKVKAESDTMVDDIARNIDHETCAIMLSRIYFESGLINQQISEVAELARKYNVPLLVDDYHGTNVVPLSLREKRMEDVFVLIGGYKYLQWGEGNCFLRFPEECSLRPAITGWFAAFSTLDEPQTHPQVPYDDGNQRFASGTYDPASQFRAANVVDFFHDQGLTPHVLHQQYQRQIRLMRQLFLEQHFDPAEIRLRHKRPIEENGGFLALKSPKARKIRAALLEKNVFTDARGDILRMGPAPYTTAVQIQRAIEILAETVTEID